MKQIKKGGVGLGLLLWICICPAVWAQGERPDRKPSPIYTGPGLPNPPQQHAAWPHPVTKLPDKLIADVGLLFDQGIADPRDCEYRQIEVVTGNCWNDDSGISKTHGWVLPAKPDDKQQFAVCWNGLVYPAVSVGDKADLAGDIKAIITAKPKDRPRIGVTFEAEAVSCETQLPIKLCLLIRLGEISLAESYWKPAAVAYKAAREDPDDPYLLLAREWCWYAFDRAVCAHMWGNDVVSRDTAKLLSDAHPLVEAAAKSLGYTRPLTRDPEHWDRILPDAAYIPFLDRLPQLLADEQRRVDEGHIDRVLDDPKKFPDKPKRIAALIRDLEVVSARQWSQPGGVSLDGDPVPQALEKEGDDAIEPLIDCMERDNRLTRSVGFGRDFGEDRDLMHVSHAAYETLIHMLQLNSVKPNDIREYWQKHKGQSVEERWYEILADDNAQEQWLEVIDRIVRPTDVEEKGGWISEPRRKPGEVPTMRGEALRSGKDPSVSALIAKRIQTVVNKEGAGEGAIGWSMSAANALRLWDAKSPVPIVRDLLKRAIKLWNQETIEFGGEERRTSDLRGGLADDIGELTILAGDDTESIHAYSVWLQGTIPGEIGSSGQNTLKPVWRLADHPEIAACADVIFNGDKSEWKCLITAPNYDEIGFVDPVRSPLIGVPAFQKHLIRNLTNTQAVGTFEVKDHSATVRMPNSTGGGHINEADPLFPKNGATATIRVCDWYAEKLSWLDGAPPFAMYWPDSKRDEACAAISAFIKRRGDRFRYSEFQQSLAWGDGEGDSAKITFPKLDAPATLKQVEMGEAIFSLADHAQVRTVTMDQWPAKATWITLKDFPLARQGVTDEKGVHYSIDFQNQGLIWQAEEIQINGKWERYYGFVGPHIIAKVPASEIEFVKDR